MGTYVVGDIHGCFEEWRALKDRIEAQDASAVFILVGDVVDRGPRVMDMIRWSMQNITEQGKYQMILGNHELEKMEWFQAYQDYKKLHPFFDYRVFKPDHYDFREVLKENQLSDQQVLEIIDFFNSLPLLKELFVDTGKKQGLQHYLVVHSFLPQDCLEEDETLKKELPEPFAKFRHDVVWNRNFQGYPDLKSTIVLHGHTPTLSKSIFDLKSQQGLICYQTNDINLDCGIVFHDENRNLAAVRLEDLAEFYLFPRPQEAVGKFDRLAQGVQQGFRENMLKQIHEDAGFTSRS